MGLGHPKLLLIEFEDQGVLPLFPLPLCFVSAKMYRHFLVETHSAWASSLQFLGVVPCLEEFEIQSC